MQMEKEIVDISIVIPLLNEEDNLHQLHQEITDTLKGPLSDKSYEIIFVDDGSRDASFEILKKISAGDSCVRVIRFRRNFGQTAAMSAGFEHARGHVIIPMDADLQNDPADIPMLLKRLDDGFDIVSGWRRNRQDKAITRRLPSQIANYIIRRITFVNIHDFGCTLKAYRREVLQETKLYGEMHRFIPAVATWSGARVTELEVNHRARVAGKAKYGLARTYKVVLDLITVKFLGSYSTKPLYVFGKMGFFSAILSFLLFIVVVYQKIAADFSMNRNPLLVLAAMMFTASIQFIMMGLLAELLVRTYHESQNRPTYVIKEIIEGTNTDEDTASDKTGA
ncbi:MAG: glycosyltransferase family 2 protein [Sedimentisphaeraceae bacterium JB056]